MLNEVINYYEVIKMFLWWVQFDSYFTWGKARYVKVLLKTWQILLHIVVKAYISGTLNW